jgi:Protein of unknown function (DUF2806)
MNAGLPAIPEGFGRAAEKLADTIRHVVDIAVGPDRIRARAQAQADSAVILAEGHAQAQEIEVRAVERLRKRETRRQQNMESITLKAIDALPPPEQISAEQVSEDWTSRFFEECQDISDEQMQQIWARILAGEVARPGSFAPKTLSVVRDLTKSDADLFVEVCKFVWVIPGAGYVPFIFKIDAPLLQRAGIGFAQLTHLTSIGLVEFNHVTSFGLNKPLKEISVSYCGRIHLLRSDGNAERHFSFGPSLLTRVGGELLGVSGAEGSEEIRGAALESWKAQGWSEASTAPGPTGTGQPATD